MKNKKIILDKSLIVISKLIKKCGNPSFINTWIYPDNKIVSTDGFKLIEFKKDFGFEDDDFSAKAISIKKPIAIKSEDILKNQKFFKNQPVQRLNCGYLLKGSEVTKVKIRTTDLETTIDVEYKKADVKPIEYEKLFSKVPKFRACFDVNILLDLLLAYKDLGVRDINLFQDPETDKPLLILNANQNEMKIRGLVMPIKKMEEEALNEIK